MEEKWWSKFQTKSQEGSKPDSDYLSVEDIKEVLAEEMQKTIEDTVAKGKQTTDEFVQWANEKIDEQPQLKSAWETTKEKVTEATDWAQQSLHSEEVKDSLSSAKNLANEAIATGKDVVNQGLAWVSDVASRPEVQQTVETVKQKSKEVVVDVKEGFVRIVNDPAVQKNVEQVKTNVNQFTAKTADTLKHGYEEYKGSALKDEWKEFTRAAVKFGKQGARVVVTTVEEVRTNEKVIATVEKGKDISRTLVQRGFDKLREVIDRREDRKMSQRMYEQDWEYQSTRKKAQTESNSPESEDFDDGDEGQ